MNDKCSICGGEIKEVLKDLKYVHNGVLNCTRSNSSFCL